MCEGCRPSDHFPRRYCLLCPELHELQYPSPFSGDLLAFFSAKNTPWLDPACWFWSTFARPVTNSEHVQAYFPRRSTVPVAIEYLPNELLDEILDLLSDDKRDVIALALSSPIIWRVALYRIQQEYEKCAGIWAGKRVVFRGQSHGETLLYPDREMTLENEEEGTKAKSFEQALFHLQYGIEQIHMPVVESRLTRTVAQQWMETLQSVAHWEEFSPMDWENIQRDLSPDIYPQDRTWVLRNLTTSEFIRSDKLRPAKQHHVECHLKRPEASSTVARLSNLLKGTGFFNPTASKEQQMTNLPLANLPFDQRPLSFAQIFLILSCQSIYAPSEEAQFQFQWGRWSGHRFDIVTLDAHQTETNPLEWADVSELAVDDVANLRFWVQQLEGGQNFHGYPRHQCSIMNDERQRYHDWSGLDTIAESSRPCVGTWVTKKPAQKGLLIRYNGKLKSRSPRRR